MSKLSSILSWLVAVAVLPLLLIYGGDFSMRQGVVLGLLLMGLLYLMSNAAAGPVRYLPYWVQVAPNWYQILTDFKLIESPEEWRSIAESLKSATGYRVLRDGVSFTVVQQSADFERTVIFWNQHQAFGSEFSFSEDMTPIQFERSTDPEGWHVPARFFMRPSGASGEAGYTLGIVVRDWWWEEVSNSCAAPLGVSTNPLTGSVEVALAVLPLKEFEIYRYPANRWTDGYITKTEPQIRRRRDEARRKLGWIAMDRASSDSGFHGLDPFHLEHKYFTVKHRQI